MDLTPDRDLDRFRMDMRAFIHEVLPPDIRERQRKRIHYNALASDQQRWMRVLHRYGRSVPHWPVEFGGCDWSPQQLHVFNDELYKADAPEYDWGGTHMIGPVIYTFGSQYLRDRFLPAIREGHFNWAQGFSEPGSGSDLASLRTRAELCGDKYVVNGQKIWTSGAADAEWGFFLVRTEADVKPQQGISFLIIKLDSPGITIRQIPQINGEAHLCEIFLDNVEVPMDQLIGEPGKGWSYAKFLLEHERTLSSFIYLNKRELDRVKEIIRGEERRGARVLANEAFRIRLAHVEAELLALEWSVLRVLAAEKTHFPEVAAASVLKIRGAELQQSIAMMQVDALGAKSLRYFQPKWEGPKLTTDWPDYVPGRTAMALISRAATIYGGTKQIQKNILAKLVYQL